MDKRVIAEGIRPLEGDFGEIDPADLQMPDTCWMKAFNGDLRTLDVVGLWQAAGLKIVPKSDGVSFIVQCPNRREHSDPEAFTGTILYKRPGAPPGFFCGRTKCRAKAFSIRDALLHLGVPLVDSHCEQKFERRSA